MHIVYKILRHIQWKKAVWLANRAVMQFPHTDTDYEMQLRQIANDITAFLTNRRIDVLIDDSSLQALAKASRQGGVLWSGHLGNHEAFCAAVLAHCPKFRGAHAALKNPYANTLLRRLRQRLGQYTDDATNNPSQARDWIRQGGLFGLMMDQDDTSPKAPRGRLFSIECGCSRWIPQLARIGHTHYWGWLESTGFNTAILHFKCIELDLNSPQRTLNTLLEDAIRQHPHLWHGFFHRRFKSSALPLYTSNRSHHRSDFQP